MELTPASDYWNLIAKSRESPILALVYRVPPRLWRGISNFQSELMQIDRRQLYAKPSTFHITVKVLRVLGDGAGQGELERLLSRTEEIVREFSPFAISFKGLGVFPTSIYVKVEDRMDQFRMINKRITAELGDLVEQGMYDGDSFIPHVTITTFNTKEAKELLSKVGSERIRDLEFGNARVFELEAAEGRMYLLLGPEETQEQGLAYLRTLELASIRKAI